MKEENVLIIAPAPIRVMPYLKIYTSILDENNINYTILNWNKTGEIEEDYKNKKSYNYIIDDNSNILKKAYGYLRYQQFVKKHLKKYDYNKLIILCPQTVFFIREFIFKYYKNNYILDIRDYSKINKFTSIINKLIYNSYFTVISSDGYKEWLPNNGKYVLSHNINRLNGMKRDKDIFLNEFIVIGTIGIIRDYEVNREIIKQLSNSNKCFIRFYGKGEGEKKLKQYCNEKNIKNCSFFGIYNQEDEDQIYQQVDIINACYDETLNKSKSINPLPNRLYNGAINFKPIIVRNNSYVSKVVKRYEIGLVVDLENDNLEEKLFEYKKNFNQTQFNNNVLRFLGDIKKDIDKFKRNLIEFINNSGG